MEYRCPKCHRLIYDRRSKKCGWCDAELPEELLFTKEESDKVNKEMAGLEEERKKFQIRKRKEDEERDRRARDGYVPPVF